MTAKSKAKNADERTTKAVGEPIAAVKNNVDAEHKFPWNWRLADLEKVEKNGKTVFSCFSCGGGSSMGYKLAGCTVLGNCEIDPEMEKVYQANHHPKHTYLMDIREFNEQKTFPDDLKSLDDG